MKTSTLKQQRRRAMTAAMILSLVWLTTGCTENGWSPREVEDIQLNIAIQEHGEGNPLQFELVLVEDYEYVDRGVVEGNPLQFGGRPEWPGFRILQGEHGTVIVEVHATPETTNGKVAEGTWTIRGGTGRYADLKGAGKFVAKSDGNGGFAESLSGGCNRMFNQ